MTPRPIRVLYVLNAVGGGASLGIYEMVRSQSREAFVPYAVLPPGPEEKVAPLRPLFEDLRTMPMPWWNRNREAGWLRRAAYTLGRKRRGHNQGRMQRDIEGFIKAWGIDLVHTGTAVTLGGALAARACGVPHIWHIKEEIGQHGRVRFAYPDAKLVAFMGGLSDRIVVMSEFIGRIFRTHQCRKLAIVPDGVDVARYDSGASRNLRRQLGLGPDQFLVGMVASLTSSWKRHDVYVKMAGLLARRLPQAHFIAIGPRPSSRQRWPHDLPWRHYEEMVALAREHVPEGRLTFLDFVPDPPDIMRSLDVLVHPCDVEPFGRIAIEAMAAKTPIVGPTTGGLAETVVDGETGSLVPPGDPVAFAEATQRLLNDEGLRLEMGQAGRRRVHGHYTIERHIERMHALYREVLRG